MIRVIIYEFGVPLICFILFSLLIYFGLKTKKTTRKRILFNGSAIFIAIFIFEIYSHIKNADHINNNASFSGSFYDTALVSGKKVGVGYGPKADTSFQVTATRKNNDSTIYEVKYSLKEGRRTIPNNNDSSKKSLYFLGGSHVFGDGLNDDQTLPYFINAHANNKYNISNYGFSGYGTHQALKLVETSILNQENIKTSSQSCAIYSFIPAHFRRAAGHVIWDPNGPLYEFENNELLFKGSFNENRLVKDNYVTKRVKTIWENSYLFKSIFSPNVKEKDVIRVSEMINVMNVRLKEQNIRFIVVLGRTDFENEHEQKLHKELNNHQIEHYFVSSIIPNFNEPDYTIVGDGHPNEKYNSALAQFIVDKLSKL